MLNSVTDALFILCLFGAGVVSGVAVCLATW